jgi:hypothetical protein
VRTKPSEPARWLKGAAEHRELILAVEAALDDGLSVPCHDRSEWLSEDAEERAEAATACSWCPAKSRCAALAAAMRPEFGVWAGRDRTRRARGTATGMREAGGPRG